MVKQADLDSQGLEHLCTFLAPEDGPSLATHYALGAGTFPPPTFAQTCYNVTYNGTDADGRRVENVTEICRDVEGAYDLSGHYRRAPSEQLYRWSDDELGVDGSGTNVTEGVADGLSIGAYYAFRVAALLQSGAAEPSAYSAPQFIRVTGPGRPLLLEVDGVSAHALRLSWRPPEFNPQGGTWHGDGGAPLIGYRILMRHAAEPPGSERLVASTRDLQISLTELPPQVMTLMMILPMTLLLPCCYATYVTCVTSP